MLHDLAKNQFVKITGDSDNITEYGLVLDSNIQSSMYSILSIGCLNENGEFITYPVDVNNIKENLSINDRFFEEVKDTKVRRKMNKWLEVNMDKLK